MIHVQQRLTDLINREGRLTVVYSVRAAGRSVVRLPGPWSLHRRHRSTEVDNDVRSSGTSKAFTIFTWTIMHLVYPPKLCITIENWRKLLLLDIQPGDKLAKPPFFVAYSRLCRHCRNLAKGACRLSRFHFRPCCYFLGHVACRNLLWQGLMVPILVDTNPYSLEKRKYGEVSGSGHVAYTSSTRARIFPESNICCGSKRSPCLYSCSMWTLHLFW